MERSRRRIPDATVTRLPVYLRILYDLAAEGKSGASALKLYNLKDDVGEATDLAAKEPERVKELQGAWDAWNKGNVAPLWGGKAKGP